MIVYSPAPTPSKLTARSSTKKRIFRVIDALQLSTGEVVIFEETFKVGDFLS